MAGIRLVIQDSSTPQPIVSVKTRKGRKIGCLTCQNIHPTFGFLGHKAALARVGTCVCVLRVDLGCVVQRGNGEGEGWGSEGGVALSGAVVNDFCYLHHYVNRVE
ncbi:hypothetical protein AVEN_113366-1 [Araneus ventricosus]|uniref:Uncharacterized protein n=1 Tax=Araneus ventricosus TaxID=182803 RepID=A0A4Y2IQL5_ARAVE|nr:hypothetical protein AVEN_113366-1 [Araneus ventricosus]